MRTSKRVLRKLEKRFKDILSYVEEKGADDHLKAEAKHLAKAIGEATEAFRLATFTDALEEKPKFDEEIPF